MTDPIRNEFQGDLHSVAFREALACDYHERPMELPTEGSVLTECIRVVDHPQLSDLPDGWIVDAARCDDHAVSEVIEPTRGYEEAVVRLPVMESNGVVSVETPTVDGVHVLGSSVLG